MSPAAPTLTWESFNAGRVLMAYSQRGYYELCLGERALYTTLAGGELIATDLGPCTQELMETCKLRCEEHRRHLRAGRATTMQASGMS